LKEETRKHQSCYSKVSTNKAPKQFSKATLFEASNFILMETLHHLTIMASRCSLLIFYKRSLLTKLLERRDPKTSKLLFRTLYKQSSKTIFQGYPF
jgi:hypothetical protein